MAHLPGSGRGTGLQTCNPKRIDWGRGEGAERGEGGRDPGETAQPTKCRDVLVLVPLTMIKTPEAFGLGLVRLTCMV